MNTFIKAIKRRLGVSVHVRFFNSILIWCALLGGQNLMAQTIEVISITPSKTTVLTGEDYTYSIQYRCAGITGNCNGQTLCLTIPPEIAHNVLLFGDAFTASSNYNASTREACWTMGNLATGITGQVTLSVQFRSNFTPNNTTATFSVLGVNAPTVTGITDPKLQADKIGASSVGADGSVTYNLSIRNMTNNGSSRGGVFQDNVSFTDTWPAGATYVAHTQNPSLPAPIITSNSITFNVGTMSSGDASGFSLTIKYPVGTFPEGSTVINEAQGKGTPRGSAEITSNKPTVTTQIQASRCDIRIGFRGDQTTPGVTAGSNTYTNFGWGNRIAIDIGNSSNVPASVDVVHDIPAALTPIKLDFYNNSASGGVNFFYKTNLNSNWTAYSANPIVTTGFSGININVSSLGLASGEYLTQIRARDNGKIPAGGALSMNYHYDFTGTDRNGNAVTGDIIAKVRYKATCDPGGIGLTPTYDPDIELAIKLVPATTELSIGKYVNPGAVTPGGVVEYTLRWDFNETGSSAPPIKPIISDLLPIGMDFVAGSAKQGSNTGAGSGGPVPAVEEVIPNYQGTGRTLIRWKFTGIFGGFFYNGSEILRFNARVKPGTSIGTLDNTFNISSDDSPTSSKFIWTNSGKEQPDTQDLDGDGRTNDIIVLSDKAVLNVVELAALESYKWVKGSLDASETRYPTTGRTTRGGTSDYRLVVRNLGNVPMKDIKVVDILPFIGDKAVIGTQDRLTAWRPNLTSAVTFTPANPNIKVYYSTSQNPCRAEVYSSSGCVNDWSLSPPTDLATVQSLKFDFGTLVMAGGDSIQLAWQMRAPIDAPTAGEIAWNSFAYSSTRQDNSVVLAPSEPVKVGISVNAPPASSSIGDYVWKDLNNNGTQESGDLGANGVKVEIFNINNTPVTDVLGQPVGATYTTNNSAGQPGYYTFTLLPAGDYYIKFTVPNPADCRIASGANTSTGNTPNFNLILNQNKTDVDLILSPAAVPCTTVTGASITLNPTSPVVAGTTVNLTAAKTDAGTPTSYTWVSSPATGFTSTTNLATLTNTAAGTYNFTVTVTNTGGTGVCTATATSSLSVSTALVPCTTVTGASITLNPTSPVVAGTTVNLTASKTDAGTPTSYTWVSSPATGFTSTTNLATLTSPAAGTYNFTVTVQNTSGTGVCTATATSSLSVSAACTNTVTVICTTQTVTLTAGSGLSNIQWYKNGVAPANAIAGETGTTYNTNAPGTYYYRAQNNLGCDINTCCGVTIQTSVCCVPPTNVTASITPPTCAGATAQNNGMLRLTGFTTEKYQYTSGSTFTGATTPASPTAIPSNSVLISNLANTAQTFTVRIYSATDNTCFSDKTISLVPVVCVCPPPICVPVTITIKN